MLYLQFKINDNRYILEARDVIEVLPYANLKRIPKAPAYVAGLLNYAGDAVPVIDVCFLMSDQPCQSKLSSRIALVNYKDADERTVRIGLLIEHLTEAVRFEDKDFSEPGVRLDESPYLGKVVVDEKRIVQLVNVAELIPDEVHDILFRDEHTN